MQEMTVRVVPSAESARLLEKQWRAKVYFMACPFRRAMNQRWRVFYKEAAKSQGTVLKLFENQSRN
jgi:hypothetical protein